MSEMEQIQQINTVNALVLHEREIELYTSPGKLLIKA